MLDDVTAAADGASDGGLLGRGGQARVAAAAGVSRNTLIAGANELLDGAGRKKAIDIDPELLVVLDLLVEPESRATLRWTAKSTRTLAAEVKRLGHHASADLVGRLLHYLGYSLQANAKVIEGAQHFDRNAQFEYINDRAAAHLAAGQPVISIDCKKKELIGDYANGGSGCEPKGTPTCVGVHDFPHPEMGKAILYGVYDIDGNEGWVNVGDGHDTPAFAVASIARWWERMGRARYPDATKLMITADAGGSNAYRSRMFKAELATLAATIGLIITVCHMPPGTSKWTQIEHRLFSFISMNWRGKPLTTYRTVVELIAATTTKTGLSVQADFDGGHYPTGQTISQADFDAWASPRTVEAG